MSELLLCGRVTEHDGDIVSVCLWSVAEFVPIGSPEHRAMVAQLEASAPTNCQCSDADAAVCRNNPKLRPSYCRVTAEENAQSLRILPVEPPESKLVGRKRLSFWQRFWGHQKT